MSTVPAARKRPIKRIILLSLLAVLIIAGIYLYNDFNRLLSNALLRSFESSIVSDVYELKFDKLRVNFWEGSIRVHNVVIQPREKPLKEYPYINSSFRLTTERLTLMNVEISTLLKENVLKLERISINKPDIELLVGSKHPIFIPFKDSTSAPVAPGEPKKKAIDSFGLDKFQLIEASIHVTNTAKEREFNISNYNLAVDNLFIRQRPGKDSISFHRVAISVGEFKGRIQSGPVRKVRFKDFSLGIDSLAFQKTVDTLTFQFHDFGLSLKGLDMHTADSLFHFSMESFFISYKTKAIKLDSILFKPNISDAEIQAKYSYQHTQVSATVGSISLTDVNFDSLIYRRSLFVEKITIDKPDVSIFKDNTKPVDKARFPKYLGQQVAAVPIPLLIKEVSITNVTLTNVERKRDSSYAKVILARGTVAVKNVTNRILDQPLSVSATAYLFNKVRLDATLGFDYRQPQFSIEGKLDKFNLPDLNPLIEAYTPAKITAGTADEISFSGMVNWTNTSGTMRFLYHDLEVDLALQNKAKWKSAVLAFAANSILNESNPPSDGMPPKIVKYAADRDMNKGFVNLIIKGALSGLKETMFMSSENRKEYKEAKKKAKGKK